MSSTQALVRLLLAKEARNASQVLNTGGFVRGYLAQSDDLLGVAELLLAAEGAVQLDWIRASTRCCSR